MPPEFFFDSPISSSGRLITAEAAVPSRNRDRGRLYVMRRTGRPRRPEAVPASAGYLFGKVAWAPDGRWLFYQGPRRQLWGYDARTRAIRSSPVPCCRYTVMAAVPAPLRAARDRWADRGGV